MADNTTQNIQLFQDLVLELQIANSTLPKIEANTYETGLALVEMGERMTFGSSAQSPTRPSTDLSKIEENTSKTAWAVMNLTEVVSYNLGNLIEVLTGNKLQEEENRRETLDVLKGLGGGKKEKDLTKQSKAGLSLGKLGIVGTIAKVLAGMGALVLGFFAGIAGQIKKVFLSTKIGAKIGDFITKGVGRIVGFFGSLSKAIAGSKVFTLLSGSITKVIQGVTDFFKPIGEVVKLFTSGGKGVGMISSFKNIAEQLGKIAKPLFNLGKLFGKLFLPLTIIMSAYDAIMGGIKGFEEGGIAGMFKGGVTELLTGLVGAPLDLLKSAVSWILGKLGFEEAEKSLDSFSFSDLIRKLIDRIVGWGQYFFELVFQPIMDAFLDISTAISQGDIFGAVKGVMKLLVTGSLDMIKNLLGGIAGAIGLKGVKEKIDSFKFGGLFGGTVSDTPSAPVFEDNKTTEAVKKIEEKGKGFSPLKSFSSGLLQAYDESAQKRMTGAEISATKASTAEMEAAAASAPVMVANSPTTVAPNINSSSQSITVNSSTHQERTNLLLMPSYAGF